MSKNISENEPQKHFKMQETFNENETGEIENMFKGLSFKE